MVCPWHLATSMNMYLAQFHGVTLNNRRFEDCNLCLAFLFVSLAICPPHPGCCIGDRLVSLRRLPQDVIACEDRVRMTTLHSEILPTRSKFKILASILSNSSFRRLRGAEVDMRPGDSADIPPLRGSPTIHGTHTAHFGFEGILPGRYFLS